MNRVPGPSAPPPLPPPIYGSYESEVKTSFKVKRNELKVPIKVEQINDNLFSILKH